MIKLLFKKRKMIRLESNKYLNKSNNHFEKIDTYSIYHIANYQQILRQNIFAHREKLDTNYKIINVAKSDEITSINIQYLSDIHLEFYDLIHTNNLIDNINVNSSILCLCGDIGYPCDNKYTYFIEQMSIKFEHVFLIAGNHEYYQTFPNCKTISEINEKIKEICLSFKNVYPLNNDIKLITINDKPVLFMGTTLWSQISKYECTNVKRNMNDYYKIYTGSKEMLTIEYVNNMNSINIAFINNAIVENKDLPIIVLTHHLPSFSLINEKYINCGINSAFANNCDYMINKPVVLWLYGHTHLANYQQINDIYCCVNPGGYPGEIDTEFNPNKFITINI